MINNTRVTQRKLRLANDSVHNLDVSLEWDVPIQYTLMPGQQCFVHGVVRDAEFDQETGADWDISLDVVNNAIAIYMRDELLLIEDFYLTDCLTSERIKPVNS